MEFPDMIIGIQYSITMIIMEASAIWRETEKTEAHDEQLLTWELYEILQYLF